MTKNIKWNNYRFFYDCFHFSLTWIIVVSNLNEYSAMLCFQFCLVVLINYLQNVLGPLGSFLIGRIAEKKVLILGGILMSVSFVLAAFAPSLPYLYFTFAVLNGNYV